MDVELAFPDLNRLFFGQVSRYGEKVAYRHKRGGSWEAVTWKAYGDTVRRLAAGLCEMGLQKGETLAVLASSRPEWDLLDRACLACGGVTVGVYETNTAEQTWYILDHADAVIVAVEDAAQLAKVQSVRERLPRLRRSVILDPPPSASRDEDAPVAFSALVERGRQASEATVRDLQERIDATRPEDVAALVYTSGTTGPPKGAVLSHRNLLASGQILSQCMGVGPDDVCIEFLPFAHVLQRSVLLAGICAGYEWAYAESIPKLLDNLLEVRPTVFGSVPRMFEKAHARILERAARSSPARRKLFEACLRVGLRASRSIQAGRPLPLRDRLLYGLARRLVFSKVREAFGGRVRLCATGSAPIAVDILEFFHAAGMLPIEGYALTETCTLGTFNRVDAYRFGTVGQVVPGMEIRIAEDGEICLRGIGLFQGYFKDPEKTREAIDEEGWFHSGDLGEIDPDGFVRITGRKKDLIITAGGKNVAPSNIENLLKSHPLVSQAMVYGDRKPYLTALITLSMDEIGSFCDERGISTRDNRELAAHPEVLDKVQEIVDAKNRELARFEQIKRFVLLDRDLEVEQDEITPTLKVKRNVVTERFRDRLDALYGG